MSQGPRLATVEHDDRPRPVLVGEAGLVFLDEALEAAPGDIRELIAGWPRWSEAVRGLAAAGRADAAAGDVRWLAPLMPRKLICVGTNYHDHVAEMLEPAGLTEFPREPFPFTFLKPPSTTLVGDGAAVRMPSYGRRLDWEAELAVVIGDPVAAAGPDPLAGIFGFSILNDLSLRDFLPFPHLLGLDAVSAKGFDGAAPMGPWITLAEDVADPQLLAIELRVNGDVMQDSSTAQMIFDVRAIVSHLARILTLEPGDVIATGTPAGVGAARKPARYLTPGDRIEARIGDLGCLRTTITEPEAGEPLLGGT